jgi:hypothetical protein
MPPSMNLDRSSVKLSLIAIFSALLFLAAFIVKITVGYGAIVYAVVLLTGVLIIRLPYAATLTCLISALLYSFISPISLLMLGTFLSRGVTIDALFNIFKVYRDASNHKYRLYIIIPAMILSGFASGLYQYFFLVVFMRQLVDFGAFIVSTIFIASIISNAAAGYIVPKYIMPRIRRVMV